MADRATHDNERRDQNLNSSHRTESLEVECNSSHAAPSTTQSVDSYDTENVQPSEEDRNATLAGAGGQFQSPTASPARSTIDSEPSQQPRFTGGNRVSQRGDTVTAMAAVGNYAVQNNHAPKRRGSTLDDKNVAQRYRDVRPGSDRQAHALRFAHLSSLSQDHRARVLGLDNEISESPTSLTGNDGSRDGELHDEDGDDDEQDADDSSGSDQDEEGEANEGRSTPKA